MQEQQAYAVYASSDPNSGTVMRAPVFNKIMTEVIRGPIYRVDRGGPGGLKASRFPSLF